MTTTSNRFRDRAATVRNTLADPTFDAAFTVRRALARIGVQEKAAAIDMGIDPSQLSRGLSGEGHLFLDRLALLPETFWIEFIRDIAPELGLRVEASDDLQRTLTDAMDALTRVIGALTLRTTRTEG